MVAVSGVTPLLGDNTYGGVPATGQAPSAFKWRLRKSLIVRVFASRFALSLAQSGISSPRLSLPKISSSSRRRRGPDHCRARTHAVRQRSGPIGALGRGHREQSRPQARAGLSDSGYCSEPNLKALVARGIDGYVAPGRAKHPTAANGKVGGPLTQLMRKKIDDGGFETPYRLRKQVVEPVFGQIKQARGFRQFLLRGVKKVRAEWAMICTTHNLLKLFTLAKAA